MLTVSRGGLSGPRIATALILFLSLFLLWHFWAPPVPSIPYIHAAGDRPQEQQPAGDVRPPQQQHPTAAASPTGPGLHPLKPSQTPADSPEPQYPPERPPPTQAGGGWGPSSTPGHGSNHGDAPGSPASSHEPPFDAAAASCAAVSGASDVLVVLKTGSTEIFEKLPEHLLTLFNCVPHKLIFSDLEQDVAGIHVHDALANIPHSWKTELPEFEAYREIKEARGMGLDLANLKSGRFWDLDKWKFLPMVHRSRQMFPDVKWAIFIEADTALSWTNFLQLTRAHDSELKLYFGAQNMLGDTAFAHGGSGIVLSQGALDAYESVYDELYTTTWKQYTKNSCCGDGVIAQALKDAGVELTPAWPMIQGETPSSLDWTRRHWCAPAVTWHHAASFEIDELWQYHNDWVAEHGWDTPYLFRDIYATFVSPHLRESRDNWDNLSREFQFPRDPTEINDSGRVRPEAEVHAHESFEKCRTLCEGRKDCLQFRWRGGRNKRCWLSNVVQLGRPVPEDDEVKPRSGWLLDRIDEWKQKREPCEPTFAFDQ